MGRRRLLNVKRDGSGRSLASKVKLCVHPETMAVRERELQADGIILTFAKIEAGRQIIKRIADDRLSGFTLGRLLLRYQQDKSNPGGISEAQFEAGEEWHEIVVKHARLLNYRLSVKSPKFEIGIATTGDQEELSEEQIRQIKAKFVRCYDAIMEACAQHGIAVRNVLYGVVIENWPARVLSDENYGHLRAGLNALVRALR